MISSFLILLYIWLAFIAMAFWESSCEGRNAWDKGKVGWKIRIGKYVALTRYHFWVHMMIILLLLLPIIIYGFNLRLFGVLLSAYFSGFVIEDFFWYVFNPVVKFSELNTGFANYYPRINLFGIKIPVFYFTGILLAVLSWLLFWR